MNPPLPSIIASPVEAFDSWLTEQFAAIIITRFFRRLAAASKDYLLYQKSRIRKASLNRSAMPLVLHSEAFQTKTTKKKLNFLKSSSSSDYFQSLLYQQSSSMAPNPSFTTSFPSSSFPSSSSILLQQSLSDKFQFWRNILELKRHHPNYPNEVLMKALIECQGDLTKAQVLIDNPEFILLQQQLLKDGHPIIQLNSSMKQLFLPFHDQYQQILQQQHQTSSDPFLFSNAPITYEAEQEQEEGPSHHLSTVRSLRRRLSHHHNTNAAEAEEEEAVETDRQRRQVLHRKKELLSRLMDIIEKTYLPTAYVACSNNSTSDNNPPLSRGKTTSSSKRVKLKTTFK